MRRQRQQTGSSGGSFLDADGAACVICTNRVSTPYASSFMAPLLILVMFDRGCPASALFSWRTHRRLAAHVCGSNIFLCAFSKKHPCAYLLCLGFQLFCGAFFVLFRFFRCVSRFPGRIRLVSREVPTLHSISNQVFVGAQAQFLHAAGSIGFDLAGTDIESGSNV